MLTKDFTETFERLSEHDRLALMALSIMIDRVGSLPKCDREELFELLKLWLQSSDVNERREIHQVMGEIITQAPIEAVPLPLPKNPAEMPSRLRTWVVYVGQTIKTLREKAGLTQGELATKAGLTQSHVSRLENAAHSPSRMTLEKIAKALDISVGQLDPREE